MENKNLDHNLNVSATKTITITELFFRNGIVLWLSGLNRFLFSGAVGLLVTFWSSISLYTFYEYIKLLCGVYNL